LVSSPGAEPKRETAVSASLILPLSSSLSETSAQIFLEWAPRENEQSSVNNITMAKFITEHA